MSKLSHVLFALVPCTAGLAACTETPDASALEAGLPYPALLAAPEAAGGVAQVPPGCASRPYHQFDFWLGDWNIFEAGGVPGGVSSVTKELGGCAVLESVDGGNGRSISFYDAARDRWTQTYSSVYGTLLRLSGRLEGADIVMEDEPRPRAQGDTIKSHVTWTPLADGTVQETWLWSGDGGATYGVLFDGNFQLGDISPPPLSPSTVCNQTIPAFRGADFLLGAWSVRTEGGVPLGRASFDKSVSGCMIEESFRASSGGYAARAFITYDKYTYRWYRIVGDTRGLVYELGGAAQAGPRTLEGETLPGVRTRATWSVVGADELRQTWESSLDGGATWGGLTTLVFQRAR